MKLGHNLLAGLANSIWSALVGLAVVPFYLKHLGIEAYGLIGFFATTQAVLSLLDMGMAPTINREVARCSASGSLQESGKLLHTLAVVYWSMAAMIALLVVLLAPWIAEYWLQSKHVSQLTISHAIMLMGLVVACRWPIGLYQGALNGAQRLTVSSGINMVMATVGSLGTVAVLAFVSPTIEAFFIWQACVGLAYAFTMRLAAWRVIGKTLRISFDFEALKRIWRFSAGMSGVALSATVLTQLDKVILSKILGLEEYGQYMLATLMVGGLYVLILPVFNAVYPRLSSLLVAGEIEKLTELYRLGTRMLGTVLFPIAMAFAVFAEEILRVWTGNPALSSSVAPIVALLAMGAALHGVMFFPYALQLAYGITRLPLKINLILTIILLPLIIIFAMTYGVLGGAMAWLVFQVLYLMLGTWLTHRQLLKGVGLKWLLHDVGVPLGLSILAGIFGHYVIQNTGYSSSVKLIFGSMLTFAVALFSFAALPKVAKNILLNEIGLRKT